MLVCLRCESFGGFKRTAAIEFDCEAVFLSGAVSIRKISFGLTFRDEGGFRVATILQSALDETMRPMNEIARIFLSSNLFQNPGNSNIGTGH